MGTVLKDQYWYILIIHDNGFHYGIQACKNCVLIMLTVEFFPSSLFIASIISSFHVSPFHFYVLFCLFVCLFYDPMGSVYLCVYLCALLHLLAVVCMWRSEDSVPESFLFSRRSSGDLTLVLRLGGKCLPTEQPYQPSVSLIRFA